MSEPSHLEITPDLVARAVYDGIRESAVTLREDYASCIQDIWKTNYVDTQGAINNSSREAQVLSDILENAEIAQSRNVPLCQDTGSVWVCLEVGTEAPPLPSNVFSLVNEAVANAYTEGGLRMSLVRDALFDRANTENNTPAFCDIHFCPGTGIRLHVLLKGGGSDNASRLVMLAPGAGIEGVKQVVLETVQEKAANACPPLLVGVGVGATFDKVAGLSKLALLRPIGSQAQSSQHAALEAELLSCINDTFIGAAALGGNVTAVAVHLNTAPCHIAALPVAVNMGCCAQRSFTTTLIPFERN